MSGDRRAVGELPSLLNLDDVMRGIVAGGDALSHLVVNAALGIISNQARKQLIDDLAAACLGHSAWEQRVCRFAAVDGNDIGA